MQLLQTDLVYSNPINLVTPIQVLPFKSELVQINKLQKELASSSPNTFNKLSKLLPLNFEEIQRQQLQTDLVAFFS